MSKDPTQLPPDQLSKLDDLSAAVREKPMEPGFIGSVWHAVTSGAHAVGNAATSAAHAVTHAIQTQTVQQAALNATQALASQAADAMDTTGGGEEEPPERLEAIGAKLGDKDELSLDELVRIRNEHTR